MNLKSDIIELDLKHYRPQMNNTLRKAIVFIILKSKRFKPENGIIIFSEPRGGSTWLMEILSNIPKVIINWEPLHERKGVVPKSMNWDGKDRPYIAINEDNKKVHNLIKKILCNSVYSDWTLMFCRIKKLISSKLVITKFVQANLLLPWILEQFEFKKRPILLLRHPVDSCLSQNKAFNYPIEQLKRLPPWVYQENRAEIIELFEKIDSILELSIAKWCVNNVKTLHHEGISDKTIVVYYEDLVLNPKNETIRILELLDITNLNAKKLADKTDFTKASKTDFKKELMKDPKEQLNKNVQNLKPQEKEKIQHIFDVFEFKLYNAYSVMAKKEYIS